MNLQTIEQIESFAIDLVAKISPWCAPVPTAYLVGRATVNHLGWPVAVGVVSAVVVETLGLASAATALELWQYNKGKRKVDPAAPFVLAATLVLLYFVIATGLTLALDIFPGLATYAQAIFPTLSLTGVTVLALRSDHKRRLESIEHDKAKRRKARQVKRQVSRETSNDKELDTTLDRLQEGRKAKRDARIATLLDVLSDNPGVSIADASRLVGVSRQTVYAYLGTLEEAGQVRRNGKGVEVVS